jgi:hypothetical protein
MSIGSINPLSNNYLQSILTSALQSTGLTTNTAGNSLSTSASSSVSQAPDSNRLSPFAQLMSELQQLQQTDPDKYKLVTGQIATNLQTASQTAQAAGDTTDATKLTQLSNDFQSASQSGQLPNVQDLAQAVGGHRHHHHHSGGGASSSSTSSQTQTQTLDQILSAFQTNGTQSAATDPMSVIMSTLASAGITGS